MSNNTLPAHKSDTGEIYSTNNFFLKILAERFTNRVENILDLVNANMLVGVDIGSAEGQLLSILFERGKLNKIYSIELESQKIQTSILHNHGHQFIQCDAQNICCKENTFDFVMATEILEHLPDPEKALEEISRIAKPNAHIIISVPHEPFFHYGNFLRGKHLARGGKTPSHIHFWHKREFSHLLTRHLFIKKCYSIATFPWLLYYCQNK